jgi:hypothetical protein
MKQLHNANTKWVFIYRLHNNVFGRTFMCPYIATCFGLFGPSSGRLHENYKNHSLFLPVNVFIGGHCCVCWMNSLFLCYLGVMIRVLCDLKVYII